MTLKVPNHRVDALAIYVCEDDDAWLVPTTDKARHAYCRGIGRFDPALLEPLVDEAKTPTKWSLVRPSNRDWLVISRVAETEGMIAARAVAARKCLRGVTGWACKAFEADRELTDDEFDELTRWAGRQVVLEVGAAAFRLAADLTEAEKKL